MAPAVILRAAVVLAGRFPALAGTDLDVDAGEVVVIEGPNGAGKTTLLRVCAGLLPVTSGEARVLGCDLGRNRAAVRSRVGMLGHAPFLYDDLTAVENVRFAVRASGGETSAVDAALERVGLSGRARRTVAGRLSTGQRRRAALATLVARRPALWLLDEPHASLDEEARVVLAGVVAEAAGAGAAVVLASHELEAAAPMADRIVSLAGGRVMSERRGGRRPVVLPAPASGGAHVA